MTSTTPAERTLFTDLTRIFMSMRDASHAELEMRIEERFRDFVRAQVDQTIGGLQITFTWTLPDGADDWAVYRTDYKTLPAEARIEPQRAAAGGGSAAILDFPSQQFPRSTVAGRASGQILSFPGR